MKKIFTLVSIALFALTSCSDDGPQGPPGPPGPPGEGGLGYTLEQTVTFDYFQENNFYTAFIDIPDEVDTPNPQMDAVLVYLLQVVDGEDTWSLIPQNFFLDQGTIQYVYNHTALDVEILIDGNFDLSNLDPDFTVNKTFRVIVLPSDIIASSGVDVFNFEAVMQVLEVQSQEIQSVN